MCVMAGRTKTWRLLILLLLLNLSQHFGVGGDDVEDLSSDVAAQDLLRRLNGGECDAGFTTCVMQQDFSSFLAAIEQHKMQDWLSRASEISHHYSQKLLVMTDREKSTNDRVQQEYSLDPEYSVIVSKECLHDVSCVPEADSYTVVKIFGRVSKDGQSVSGLSGSSLAELILKPSLKAAPVFSIDGNTTKHFQKNFCLVLKVRGVKSVLETTQDNQQTYQLIKEGEIVSSYRIPQRPVDHTTQYDHQQIIIMEEDHAVQKAAAYLYEKHPTASSVYTLDKNQRLKLYHGDPVPISKNSRLVLVGHGRRDNSGEMRVAGYRVQDVSRIIQQTFRVSDNIKTTSVVACEVGSDKDFAETLLRELRAAGIETELHLRDAVIQVRHTGEKITQVISADGLQWRHKDDSKKVVATLDKNGNVIMRIEPGSKGEAVFTSEMNSLGPNKRFLVYRDSWPDEPGTFVDQNVFERLKNTDQNRYEQIINSCHELEALSWGFFHADLPVPQKISVKNLEIEGNFVIGRKVNNKMQWIEKEMDVKYVLSNCYEIQTGKDVRNIIRHHAKNGENKPSYLMVNDWIHFVNPENLYIHPVGKRLNNNQRENRGKVKEIKDCIEEQIGQEKYPDMIKHILDQNLNPNINPKEDFAHYVKDILLGERTTRRSLSTEAWYTTYFTASVISESARNFRTFPLILMALDMVESPDNNIREKGLNFLFEEHSMARGLSWIDPSRRGFSGSATPKDSSKLQNVRPHHEGELMRALEKVISKEVRQYQLWIQVNGDNIIFNMLMISEKYKFTESNSVEQEIIFQNYKIFKDKFRDTSVPSASGTLGGYDDGRATSQDLKAASELEKSFKLESYFSRATALSAEQIYNQVKNLEGWHLQEGTARIENRQFICQLVSDSGDAQPEEFRIQLSAESQRFTEKMLTSIDTAVQDLKFHQTDPHLVNKYAEHSGTAVGILGLMLGMKGAVRAFEQQDKKDGMIGILQTTHGVTAMTTSAIARKTLSSETIPAETGAIKLSPVMRVAMRVIPIVGIGFGVVNIAEDLQRGDTLGYIDTTIDSFIFGIDVIEMIDPWVAPVNLVLSTVRMAIDDVYMGIRSELHRVPKSAGVVDKLSAVLRGFGTGILHFDFHVASFFYDWRYDEIEEGHRFVEQISDYHKYYRVIKERDGASAIDFSGGESSWNGGGIEFSLNDQGQSDLCMESFVSNNESFGRKCWKVDTRGCKDIILGLGESHKLEHKKLQKKILLFIPAGSAKVVSGFKNVSSSRYGTYKGNSDANHFFAVQTAEKQTAEVMLDYSYKLYGEEGDDIFFLGPQTSYVEGLGGNDTYIIPENGGKTTINNSDPLKAHDTLLFSVKYSEISVSKSGDDVVLMYESDHTVTIIGWFLGEQQRHMNMMSGDGILFDISSAAKLVARGINKMFKKHGESVNASQPLLHTVTNIFGSRYDDVLIGNGQANLIDGKGGRDHLIGGEGEDVYMVTDGNQTSVFIENHSKDGKTDLAIIDANLHSFKVRVEGDDVVLNAFNDNTAVSVTLVKWFASPADRHLNVITKDLIIFTISDKKADCLQSDPFTKCIKSRSVDYSGSRTALVVDLEKDQALGSVMEVRGSDFDDVIRGNNEHNVVVPGRGNDFIQGRGGEDWYIITPGQGIKTINNQSPDRALDVLILKAQYQHITCACEGQSIIILICGRRNVILQNWFNSKNHQHLQIKTSDGVTAGLTANIRDCAGSLMLPLTVDYRDQRPEPLYLQKPSTDVKDESVSSEREGCFRYKHQDSVHVLCDCQGKVMIMKNYDSVKEMFGSPGFDFMVGNVNENLLDPNTGGAVMFGGEGKDTYVIRLGCGELLVIDNFAEDENIDTVLVDMDFLDGSQLALDSSTKDLKVMITTKGRLLEFSLFNFNKNQKYQHLQFQSSDGVNFKLKSLNSSGVLPVYGVEAFKVTLKQSQVDCRLDVSSQGNLSTVRTVQGCPFKPNNIRGNAENNALFGGRMDDILEGGEGDDTLIGGNGDDFLIGDTGDDALYGEDGNDTMMGGSGRDVFIPGPGADRVDGGPGRDAVLYRGDHDKGDGVYVNLLTGKGRFADAEGDVLKDVETVIGTIYSDILVSGLESSVLMGSDGRDVLVSTGGDNLAGGDGSDVYILAFSHGSVTINNCAKDDATDVLYLSSQSLRSLDCQVLPDRVLLTFFGFYQAPIEITLEGWVSDDHECGHLNVVFWVFLRSVDELLQDCKFGEEEDDWSSLVNQHESCPVGAKGTTGNAGTNRNRC